MKFRFRFLAACPVDPEPIKQSNTVSPSLNELQCFLREQKPTFDKGEISHFHYEHSIDFTE